MRFVKNDDGFREEPAPAIVEVWTKAQLHLFPAENTTAGAPKPEGIDPQSPMAANGFRANRQKFELGDFLQQKPEATKNRNCFTDPGFRSVASDRSLEEQGQMAPGHGALVVV